MSISIYEEKVVVHGDFETVAEKSRAVFLADLFRPGGGISSLDPQRGKTVEVELAPDVKPETVQFVCAAAGIEVKQD